MVGETAHLPDDNPTKFKNKSIRDHKRAVRRLKNEGQVTMTQLLGDLNSTAKSSGSDMSKMVKKGWKKCRRTNFKRNSGETCLIKDLTFSTP